MNTLKPRFFQCLVTATAAVFALMATTPVRAGSGTETRWLYQCADGYIEVIPSYFPRTFVWDGIELFSHSERYAGYSARKTLSDAVNWCRSKMNATAMGNCEATVRSYGGTASYWFQAEARLLKKTWDWWSTTDGNGNLVVQKTFPRITTVQQSTVSWSGTCGSPGPIP